MKSTHLLLAALGLAVILAVAGMAMHHNSGSVVRLRAATTTSLYATGLLDYLAENFEKQYPGIRVEFIPVGSGEALRKAAQGDVCLVLVHAPSLEKKYIEQGVITGRRIFAYNYFAVIGPTTDPAEVKASSSAVDAFKRIYQAGEKGMAKFVSRGDNSGTHVREMMIWRLAGLDPRGRSWYVESGQGMAQTLVMAEEMGAYTLSDTGTYLKLKLAGRLPHLELLYTNSSELINVYSVYLVASCKGEERRAAEAFADYIASHQELIEGYGADRYGKPLFYPAKGREQFLEQAWQQLAEQP